MSILPHLIKVLGSAYLRSQDFAEQVAVFESIRAIII